MDAFKRHPFLFVKECNFIFNYISVMKSIYKLVISILVPLLVGGTSSFFTIDAIKGWYTTLNKPFFTPPNWLFGPAWTTLYILMGISFYMIWNNVESNKYRNKAYLFFAIQLILNFFWSIIFFYFQNPLAGLIEIILMLFAIIMSIFYFSKISKIAAWLLVPYVCWVSFATALNLAIWHLN
jgi:translocator protein